MSKPITLLFLVPLLLLGACDTPQTVEAYYKAGKSLPNVPYKNGATWNQVEQAKAECLTYAWKNVPQQTVYKTTPIYTTPSSTQCNMIGTQMFCNTIGGGVHGGELYSVDANEPVRQQVALQCMQQRGFVFTNLPPCPKTKGKIYFAQDNNTKLPNLSGKTCYSADGGDNFSVFNAE